MRIAWMQRAAKKTMTEWQICLHRCRTRARERWEEANFLHDNNNRCIWAHGQTHISRPYYSHRTSHIAPFAYTHTHCQFDEVLFSAYHVLYAMTILVSNNRNLFRQVASAVSAEHTWMMLTHITHTSDDLTTIFQGVRAHQIERYPSVATQNNNNNTNVMRNVK